MPGKSKVDRQNRVVEVDGHALSLKPRVVWWDVLSSKKKKQMQRQTSSKNTNDVTLLNFRILEIVAHCLH